MDDYALGGGAAAPATTGQELLRPPHLTPVVEDLAGADNGFVEVGRRYWAWLGFDRDPATADSFGPRARWAETTAKIAADAGEHATRLYVVAAAGVTATLPQVQCPTCHAPVVLKSRQALDVLASGGSAQGQCARCSDTLQRALAKLTDPAAATKRRAHKEREQAAQLAVDAARTAHRAKEEFRRAWLLACRKDLHEFYPLTTTGPDGDVDFSELDAPLRTEVGILAMLDYAPNAAPLPPVADWPFPLAPITIRHDLLVGVLRSGLLRVHPDDSPLEAFLWEPDFEQAYAETGGDLNALSPPTTETLFPARLAWYAWQGPSIGTSPDVLREHLNERVSGWLTTEQGQANLLQLLTDVIAAEARRYFDDQLAYHQLPQVADNHDARLTGAITRIAAVRPLGQIYSLIWRAIRAGAAAAQATKAPLANMTTHAVNRFEDSARRAVAEAWALEAFAELRDLPLTALTRTLFNRVLNTDPMTTSVEQVAAGLSKPIGRSLHVAKGEESTVDALRHAPVTDVARLRERLTLRLSELAAQESLPDILDALEHELLPWTEALNVDGTGRNALQEALARLIVVAAALAAELDDPRAVVLATFAAAATISGQVNVIDEFGEQAVEGVGPLLSEQLFYALCAPGPHN